jgi:hypothetical protein
MKEIQFQSIGNRKFEIGNSLSITPVIPSKNKPIDNLSSLITCIPVFLSTCPFSGLFGTCFIPVWYRFVSISIGIFPYVFVPQTSFLNQKCGFAPFSDFLNFANIQIPGVHAPRNRDFLSGSCSCRRIDVSFGRDYITRTRNIQDIERSLCSNGCKS